MRERLACGHPWKLPWIRPVTTEVNVTAPLADVVRVEGAVAGEVECIEDRRAPGGEHAKIVVVLAFEADRVRLRRHGRRGASLDVAPPV